MEEKKEKSEDSIVCRVIAFRHGQGKHNLKVNGVEQLQLFDPDLTEQGEDEAKAIFKSLTFIPDVAFVSPLTRTLCTAHLALEATYSKGWPCRLFAHEDIREGNNHNGCNNRKTLSTIKADSPKVYAKVDWSLVDESGPRSGIEFRADLKDEIDVVKTRAIKFLEFLKKEHVENGHSSIALFSHAGFIRCLIACVIGLGRHHSVNQPVTGSGIELHLMKGGDQQFYWRLSKGVTVMIAATEDRIYKL